MAELESGAGGSRLLRATRALQRAQMRLAMLALVVMMLVIVVDVILRAAFNAPIHGSYDIVEVTLLVFVFHGISTTFWGRRNIVIDLIDRVLGPRSIAVLVRLGDVLTVATLLVIGWAMSKPAMDMYAYGDRKLELQLPIWWMWLVAFLGLAGALLTAAGMFRARARDVERSLIE